MFMHNFKYSLKTLFRNKALIFWTFAFPIILGTFFNLAFSDIEKKETFDIIDIAIVNNQEFNENEIFKKAFQELSDENNKDRLFNTKYTTLEEAKKLLVDEEIAGYMELNGNKPKLTFETNGINQTIFKYVTEEIEQTNIIISSLTEQEIKNEILSGNTKIDYQKIYENILNLINSKDANLNDISSKNLSYTMIEFYTLIAMACLYGGILGSVIINQNLANMTNQGKRISVSSIPKIKILLGSVCACFITQLIGLALLFIYTIFILNVDYGNNLLLVILLAIAGCLAGLALGIFTASTVKANENAKTGIIIAVTMLGCFLSGMMGITMKYIVDKNLPILNKINPASMITDGFYSLYYYDTLDRYIFDILSLLTFAFILIFISFISLRRQKYDSI